MVLVWRSPDGLVPYAAVHVGDRWVFHKPSSGWTSPYKILTIAGCKASSRARSPAGVAHEPGVRRPRLAPWAASLWR